MTAMGRWVIIYLTYALKQPWEIDESNYGWRFTRQHYYIIIHLLSFRPQIAPPPSPPPSPPFSPNLSAQILKSWPMHATNPVMLHHFTIPLLSWLSWSRRLLPGNRWLPKIKPWLSPSAHTPSNGCLFYLNRRSPSGCNVRLRALDVDLALPKINQVKSCSSGTTFIEL